MFFINIARFCYPNGLKVLSPKTSRRVKYKHTKKKIEDLFIDDFDSSSESYSESGDESDGESGNE